jgi:hypothetical protein
MDFSPFLLREERTEVLDYFLTSGGESCFARAGLEEVAPAFIG